MLLCLKAFRNENKVHSLSPKYLFKICVYSCQWRSDDGNKCGNKDKPCARPKVVEGTKSFGSDLPTTLPPSDPSQQNSTLSTEKSKEGMENYNRCIQYSVGNANKSSQSTVYNLPCDASVIIGGGTGFIGSNLGKYLSSCNYHITNVSRRSGNSSKSVKHVFWDELWAEGLPKDVHGVINLAGQPIFSGKWTPELKKEIIYSRVKTTKILTKLINMSPDKPKTYVVVTGVGIYPPSRHPRDVYDEYSKIKEGNFFNRMVIAHENAAAPLKPPVRLVIIRAGLVLGRNGGLLKNSLMPFCLGLGGRVGDGKQPFPWIHEHDLSRLIKFCIENPVSGVLNGVAPAMTTSDQFTKALAKWLGRPYLIKIPNKIFNKYVHPERAELITKGQYVVPARVLKYGFKYTFTNIEDALYDLTCIRCL